MNQQRHIIKKQIIELNLSSQEGAFELQNEVSRIYRLKVIPLIDNLLSQFSDADKIHRINTLEINLGNIDINNLEQELIDKITEQIKQQLAKTISLSSSSWSTQPQSKTELRESSRLLSKNAVLSSEIEAEAGENIGENKITSVNATRNPILYDRIETLDIASKRASQLEIFSYFIQTGMLPWWAKKLSKQELEEYGDRSIINSPNQVKHIVQQSLKNAKQLQRIIYQFSDSILLKIAGLFTANLVKFIADYHTDIKSVLEQLEQTRNIPKTKLRLDIWQGLLFSLSSDRNTQVDKLKLIEENLLHIATINRINYPDFLNKIAAEIEHIVREGKRFKSTLPEILDRIQIPSKEPQFVKEREQLEHLLRELQHLDLNSQILPQHKQQINQLKTELKALLNDISNPAQLQSLSDLITHFKQLQKTCQTLKANIQQELNSNQTRFYNAVNTFSDSDEIYIYNAGLILLWPFLNRFFVKIGLVQEQIFLNTISAERAALVLQYLVDNSTEIPEHILPLNKILCGIDLLEPIDTKLEITEQERAESENLLSAVIQNWSILKNTSIEGFRKAFLQRNSILRVRDGGWLLQVERETYDVLLDRIPWSIRVVKLPWMDNILYVEW